MFHNIIFDKFVGQSSALAENLADALKLTCGRQIAENKKPCNLFISESARFDTILDNVLYIITSVGQFAVLGDTLTVKNI